MWLPPKTHQNVQAVEGQRSNDQREKGAIHISRVCEGTGHGQDASAHGSLQEVGECLKVSGESGAWKWFSELSIVENLCLRSGILQLAVLMRIVIIVTAIRWFCWGR